MQEIQFDGDNFKRISSFYQEKGGKYQAKKLDIQVVLWNGQKETVISEVTLNLSSYIGRGLVKDNIQMTGNVYFIEFEVSVGPLSSGSKPRPKHN